MKILFATCVDKPGLTADDRVLARVLNELGADVQPLIWSDPDSVRLAGESAAVLIRSVWDYHLKLNSFYLWLDQLEASGVRTLNSLKTVRWNIEKTYLRSLADAGTPCVPTAFLSRSTSRVEARLQLNALGWTEIVVKPTISAGSFLTNRLQSRSEGFEQILVEIQKHSGAMVQPYLPEVEGRGEISLIYFRSNRSIQYSHAVNKLPRKNDFRVQDDFGGVDVPIPAASRLIDLGERSLRTVPGEWLSARVDFLNWATDPLLSEIELIEPDLFLRHYAPSARNFGQLILNALK